MGEPTDEGSELVLDHGFSTLSESNDGRTVLMRTHGL